MGSISMTMRRQRPFLVVASLSGPGQNFRIDKYPSTLAVDSQYMHKMLTYSVCLEALSESVLLSPLEGLSILHRYIFPLLCYCDMPYSWSLPASSHTIISQSFQPMEICFQLTCSVEWFIRYVFGRGGGCMFFEKVSQKEL